jgi:hypothetical protein
MQRGDSGNGKPRVHARDHEHGGADTIQIHYEDVGGEGAGGGGGGIQFDTDPQAGGFLVVSTTASGGVSVHADNGGVDLSSDDFVDLTSTGDGGIWLHTQGAGNLLLEAQGTSGVDIQLHTPALLRLLSLPTSDPGVGGAVWRDGSGFLRIS